MKKVFVLFLSMVLISGCASNSQGGAPSDTSDTAEETTAPQTTEITLNELKSYLTYHEVTAENWGTIFSHSLQKDYGLDAFGEETNRYYVSVVLILNEEYALTKDYVMRMHLKASGMEYGYPRSWDTNVDQRSTAFMPLKKDVYPESIVLQLHSKIGVTGLPMSGDAKYESSIDEYTLEFVKAIGSAVTIDIPEEIWTLDEKTGKRFFTVVYSEYEEEIKRKLYEDGSWVLLKNGTVIQRFNPKDEYYEWPDDLPVYYLVNAGWKLFDFINK